MSGTLAPLLLRIAAAVDDDGGAGVRAALESVLQDRAPFEAGAIVYARPSGEPATHLFGEAREPFLGRDLVEHVLTQGVPLRLDDLRDAAPFPETLALLRHLGMRSVLILPFRFGDSGPRVRGAVAVARSHGWAFAGASLPLLVPVAGLAGLAFDLALRLSAPGAPAAAPAAPAAPSPVPVESGGELDEARAQAEAARVETAAAWARAEAAGAEAQAARGAVEDVRAELEAARQEVARAAEGLREAAEAGRSARASLEAAEASRLEAERGRDDWAQQAAALRSRNEEQAAEIQGLKRSVTGARESAAAAAEVAEGHAARIRDLEAALQRAVQECDQVRREADEALQVLSATGRPPGETAATAPESETPPVPAPAAAPSGPSEVPPEPPVAPGQGRRLRARKGRASG